MTDKEKYAIKIAIDTMDKYNSRYWNTRYGSLKTGVSVWYGEAISILSDMLSNADSHTCNCQHNSNSRDSEPCCRCDNRKTNADRIRNMSDEELAEFIVDLNNHCLAGIGECDCSNESTVNCEDICNRKTLEWLQSEAE